MLPRRLEPEVMDTAAEAEAYDLMDHRDVNRRFVDDFLAHLTLQWDCVTPLRGVDLGTGTAQIPIELCSRKLPIHLVATDLSREMLLRAEANIAAAGCGESITLVLADGKGSAHDLLPQGGFDFVISNSIVHHIPDPALVFREFHRLSRPGAAVFIRDLLRPSSQAELQSLVEMHTPGATPEQKQLFADSLYAALTLDEVGRLCANVGWRADAVKQTSDRHWTFAGWHVQ